MKTTVIYHSADYDGIFCREIARHFLGDRAKYIGWNFGDPLLDDALLAHPLIILDLPVGDPFGLKFKEGWICKRDEQLQPIDRWDSSNIVWIDHHKSSIDSHPTDIPGYRIDGVAACRLAWQWFQHPACRKLSPIPKEDYVDRRVVEPLAVRLAGEYDIWDKRDPDAETFQYGLKVRKLSEHDWIDLFSMRKASIDEIEQLIAVGHTNILNPDGTHKPAVLCGLLSDGRVAQSYAQLTDAEVCNSRTWLMKWEGLKFLCVNSARFNSLFFAAKDVPETGHDALLGFCFNGKVWTVSLYHANHRKDLDLSTIAVKYGGGGHKGACGFTCEKLPFFV